MPSKVSSIRSIGKIHGFFLMAMAFLLPVTVKGFPLFTAVTSVLGLLYYGIVQNWINPNNKFKSVFDPLVLSFKNLFKIRGLGLLVVFWLYHVVSLIWSSDLTEGWDRVVIKSSFLYFPLFFAIAPLNLAHLKKMSLFFILGCLFSVFINSVLSYYYSGFELNSFYFTYVRLSHLLMHPSYSAMPINIGIAIMLFYLSRNWFATKWKIKILMFVGIFLLSFFIILLSSKAGILSWILTFIVFAIFIIIKHKRYFIGVGLILWVFSLLYISLTSIDSLNGRFVNFTSSVSEKAVGRNGEEIKKVTSSTASRKLLWLYSLDLLKTNWAFGYGVGDVSKELRETYKAAGNKQFAKHNYNSHNQFLQTALQIGVFGLAILVLIAWEFIKGMRYYAGLTICILLIFTINLSVESMLERQAGVTIISWILALSFVVRHNMKKMRGRLRV